MVQRSEPGLASSLFPRHYLVDSPARLEVVKDTDSSVDSRETALDLAWEVWRFSWLRSKVKRLNFAGEFPQGECRDPR